MATATGIDEFEIIARYFRPLAANAPGALRLLDDAALIEARAGHTLVVTTDTVVAGVHFLGNETPEHIADKLIGVNLSDLAAMGAEPRAYLLSAALPAAWDEGMLEQWLEPFAARLAARQAEHGIVLIGGDTVATPGPLSLTVTALGDVETGRELRRSGAKPGDLIFVSGTIGDAAFGLLAATGRLDGLETSARAWLVERYRTPRPRLALGRRLRGVASAAADISDGLVADLGRICIASRLAAVVEVERVPLSPAALGAVGNEPELLRLALSGGDDYELVFTTSPDAADELASIAREIDVALTMIGRIEDRREDEPGGEVRLALDGVRYDAGEPGWRHFAARAEASAKTNQRER